MCWAVLVPTVISLPLLLSHLPPHLFKSLLQDICLALRVVTIFGDRSCRVPRHLFVSYRDVVDGNIVDILVTLV
jgi:hypothetical protein